MNKFESGNKKEILRINFKLISSVVIACPSEKLELPKMTTTVDDCGWRDNVNDFYH